MTESEVRSSFGKLFQGGPTQESVEKAELLLEEHLRPENPLRHRLAGELEEIKQIQQTK